MKIIVVGGAGDVGSRAADELTRLPGVEQLTIADRDARRAAQLSERLAGRGPTVRSVAVDATAEGALGAAIEGHDVAADGAECGQGRTERHPGVGRVGGCAVGFANPPVLGDVANRFSAARRVLNHLADQHLYRLQPGWNVAA